MESASDHIFDLRIHRVFYFSLWQSFFVVLNNNISLSMMRMTVCLFIFCLFQTLSRSFSKSLNWIGYFFDYNHLNNGAVWWSVRIVWEGNKLICMSKCDLKFFQVTHWQWFICFYIYALQCKMFLIFWRLILTTKLS